MDKKSPHLFFVFYLFLFFFVLKVAISFFLTNPTLAAKNMQEEYRKVQEEMKIQKKKLESTKKTEKKVLEDIKKLNSEILEIEKNLESQRSKIANIRENINNVRADINSYNKKLSYQNALLKKRIKAIQKMVYSHDPLLVLLSEEDPSKVLKYIRYLKDVSSYDQLLMKKYSSTILALNEKVKKLQSFEAELQKEEEQLKKIEQSYQEKKAQKEKFLVNVRKEKSLYENMIKELNEASNRILKIIEEANRKEKELRKKKGAQQKLNIKEEDLPEYSAFTKLKGKLSWPVVGSIAVPYGQQLDPLFNLPVFRSGIHIKTSPNSQVKAVYDGKIVFADSFKGFGQLIIVDHGGGYHTLYGNLSRLFSHNGAIIKERQVIGETGESQLIGASGLYFEIRYKGKALNPEQWLKKT
ncbi:MAG: DUF6523 family protein [Thermodesulfovibrionales bacterium]|nr:DUF6523 family protein [Thermodesulfovibrionales bacterium]